MEKEIIWTEKALQDRFDIYTFWEDHNRSIVFSEKLDLKIQNSVLLIAKYPSIGRKSDFFGVRMKVLTHVSIFYIEKETQVLILRIWDNRQNPERFILF